jgi:BRCA1-associated protein
MSVPSFLIPDILNFFAAALDTCKSISIVKHYGREIFMAIFSMYSHDAAKQFILEYQGRTLTTLGEPSICILYPVKRYTHDKVVFSSAETGESDRPGDMKQDNFMSSSADVGANVGNRPRSLTETYSHHAALPDSCTECTLDSDSLLCAICIETFDTAPRVQSSSDESNTTTCNSSTGTMKTFCDHKFHIRCFSKLQSSECPVCRFHHDSTPEVLSVCVSCAQISSCCDRGRSTTHQTSQQRVVQDLWCCILCGFMGCGRSELFHIRQHYEETLHAYCMNTETRRVYDFAGDGYVHRLIFQKAEEILEFTRSGESSPSQNPSLQTTGENSSHYLKLVEMPNPRQNSSEFSRSRYAPLTTDQEEMLVNRKLEAAAFHYNQLLGWQLEKNREIYESRLQRLRAFTNHEGGGVGGIRPLKASNSSLPSSSIAPSSSWAENVVRSLRREKAKIQRQLDGVQQRCAAAGKNLDEAKQFHATLMFNKEQSGAMEADARRKLSIAEQSYREKIGVLKQRVNELFTELDEPASQRRVHSTTAAANDD